MNFAFILDCSISMLQAPNNQMNLLGMAKNAIEYLTKCRNRFPESKYDHYHLITTNVLAPNVISSWENDFSHFMIQLKNITYSPRNDLIKALLDAFEIINKFRDLTGADNYLGGRDPYKTDHGIILIFTDASDILTLHNLKTIYTESPNLCKWDQQVYIIQMAINLTNDKKIQEKANLKTLEQIAQSFGGKLFLVESYESLFQLLESFIMNYKFKVCFTLEALTTSPNSNIKFFLENPLKSDEPLRFLINMNLKLSNNFLTTKYQLEGFSGSLAQFPFPEEPLPLNMIYNGFPNYYIDFNKLLNYRLPIDFPCERCEIENIDLGTFIKNMPLEKKDFYKKAYFPVYFKNKYSKKDDFVIFGLLKFMQATTEEKYNMEFFCFSWNFLDFCSIWEDIIKTGIITSSIIERLTLYFQTVPLYYSSYFFQLFQFKNFHDLCIKKWKFASSQIDLTMHISNIKKKIFEKLKIKKKIDEEVLISKQIHAKHEAICCYSKKIAQKPILNNHSDQQKQKLIEELFLAKSSIVNATTCELINDNFFMRYLKNNDQKEKKNDQEIKKTSTTNEIRNPFLEENEIKYVKEPVPYGNPFKLVLRSKTQKLIVNGEISDEAYLANIIQEKEIKTNSTVTPKASTLMLKKNKIIDGNTKTESKEKETKEINGTLKDYSNGAIFQTLREKTNSEDYHEVFFNSKNFESNNKKVQDFLINNTKRFMELNHLINESELTQEKLKKLKNFIEEWINDIGDEFTENHLRKKINEILEIHNVVQDLKF